MIDGKVTFLPLYVDIELRVAQGVKNATDAEWTSLTDMYSRAVAHIDFNKIKGNRCKSLITHCTVFYIPPAAPFSIQVDLVKKSPHSV